MCHVRMLLNHLKSVGVILKSILGMKQSCLKERMSECLLSKHCDCLQAQVSFYFVEFLRRLRMPILTWVTP